MARGARFHHTATQSSKVRSPAEQHSTASYWAILARPRLLWNSGGPSLRSEHVARDSRDEAVQMLRDDMPPVEEILDATPHSQLP